MIRVRQLAKSFHKGSVNETRALAGVDIDVAPGDFMTIIGSNGAGKSTFLNALAGCFAPDAGSIVLDGQDVTRWPEYRRAALIGRVFQDPLLGTCAGATIEQNLALAAGRGRRRGLRRAVRAADRARYREQLAGLGLGLEERLSVPAGLISGGQRQALTMLMATLVRPRVLLLDEHTAALDPKTASMILELTGRIVAEHRLTTLMVTHNMRQAIAMGNRLVMFHQGRVVLDVSGEDKTALTVDALLDRFSELRGGADQATDRMLLC